MSSAAVTTHPADAHPTDVRPTDTRPTDIHPVGIERNATEPLPRLGSHLVAMVTPMLPDGRLDTAAVPRLVAHLLHGDCDGLVVAGTTGEAATLTGAETAALVEQVVDLTRGRATVTAGVGSAGTAASVASARAARRAGADAVLVVTPYYVRPGQAGIVAHHRAVADAAELPVVLYDVPHRTGTAMTADTLRTLAAHPNVVALKDARGDLAFAAALARELAPHPADPPRTTRTTAPPGLDLYCGTDDLALPYLAVGAVGLVSVVGNVVPRLVAALVDAVRAGDLAAARRLDARLRPLVTAVNRDSQGAVLAKRALVRLGVLEHAAVRLPLLATDGDALPDLDVADLSDLTDLTKPRATPSRAAG